MFLEYDDACNAILDAGQRVYAKSMVAANDGNISCRLNSGSILITASGISKGYMKKEMLVEVDLHGKILKGEAKPSTETTMHIGLYFSNPEIGAIVHAHPAYATAFACTGKPLSAAILPEAIVNLGEIPLLPYYHPGSMELAKAASAYAYTHKALLLANHGAITWGKDLKTALFRMESLEHYAKILFYAQQLGDIRTLSPQQIEDLANIHHK